MTNETIPMLALGGPLHGQTLQVRRQAYTVLVPDNPQGRDLPHTRVTYLVREVAIFGRRVRLLVMSGLTDDKYADLAWEAVGSDVVRDLHARQMEQENQ